MALTKRRKVMSNIVFQSNTSPKCISEKQIFPHCSHSLKTPTASFPLLLAVGYRCCHLPGWKNNSGYDATQQEGLASYSRLSTIYHWRKGLLMANLQASSGKAEQRLIMLLLVQKPTQRIVTLNRTQPIYSETSKIIQHVEPSALKTLSITGTEQVQR